MSPLAFKELLGNCLELKLTYPHLGLVAILWMDIEPQIFVRKPQRSHAS